MRVIAIVLLSFASRANGHGYMTEPPSRQFEAYEANGWPNEVAEYDPHGVAAGGMYSECDGCSGRSNYGPNPWSAPGTARAVDFVMGGAGNNILGVCGASPSRDNDYNTPLDGHWGMSAKTTYKAGDVIDVAWCVSADHGGVPQFRLCDDEGLVSAVTTPGYKPTVADHEALEQCFQRGLLRCDGVDSNTCDQVAECDTYAKDWEACADRGKYLHCSGGSPGERGCKNTAETCAHGILARYKLKIPESTKASSHTILVANSAYGVDAIDYVHFMMYDINAQEGFPGAPEQYFVQYHYEAVIDSSLQYIPASKMVIGFEPGLQAYTGVSGGVEHEKSIISYLNGKVGGIMFWAVNEGARAPNGKTTGENSIALANYAAAL